MARTFLLADRKWLHWDFGDWAPEGRFRFRVCPPAKHAEPLLTADKPWEAMSTGWHTVLHDGGRYRCWYEAWGETYAHDSEGQLCYAESDDGLSWHKPELGLVEYRGATANNILIAGETAFYGYGLHGSSVFLDPTAPEQERYKLIYMGQMKGYFDGWGCAVVQAYSDDGLHWQARRHSCWDGPPTLLAHASDTQTVVFWDPSRRQYVGYFRTWEPGYARCIGRSETNDFYNWPAPRTIIRCDHLDAPGADLYNNAASRYESGGDSAYFIFTSVFNHDRDDLYVQLATSRDGIAFDRFDRASFIPNGPAPFDRGGIYTAPGVLPFRRGLAIYYHGVSYKHGEASPSQIQYQGALGMVTLPRDRFQGIHADDEFAFSLQPFALEGGLSVNAETAPGGEARAALICDGKIAAGFDFADCRPIVGDQPAGALSWKGELTPLMGKPVMLRLRLRQATVYAVSVG
ncbi:MAG TPA: hypothetical protein VM221_13560 [Armatimonadota bacterium]|nr:hypothetical protein [Armatimonadota bacterium]